MTEPRSWEVFNRDAAARSGYVYTSGQRLSSRLATARTTELLIACDRFRGRSVLDVGCGDGYYSVTFWDRTQPRSWVGIDAAEEAIKVANARKEGRSMVFETGDGHHLRYAGFVPMFSPDLVARAMKGLEPLVEATPLLRSIGCAVIAIVARRAASRRRGPALT